MLFSAVYFSLLPSLALGYSVGPLSTRRRPDALRGMNPSQNPYGNYERRETRAVNDAFSRLQNELRENNQEEMLSKTKAWIDRSFTLFEELNRDISTSEEEALQNTELLGLQKKWANNIADLIADLGKEISVAPPNTQSQESNRTNPQFENGCADHVPRFFVLNEDMEIRIIVELPGVKLADIDIALDQQAESLVVSAERGVFGKEKVTKRYTNTVELDAYAIDYDKIKASLSDGILVIAAAKKLAEDNKAAYKKIPIEFVS